MLPRCLPICRLRGGGVSLWWAPGPGDAELLTVKAARVLAQASWCCTTTWYRMRFCTFIPDDAGAHL